MRRKRAPRILVTDPRVAVVESPEAADPAVLDAALELLVKWAVRAQGRGHLAANQAPTGQDSASCGSQKRLDAGAPSED